MENMDIENKCFHQRVGHGMDRSTCKWRM